MAFLQFYLPEASGRRLQWRNGGDTSGSFECADPAPDQQLPPIAITDRGAVFHAFLEGLEGTTGVWSLARAELPPEAGPVDLALGPAAPPDFCSNFSFGSEATEMAFTSFFGPTSLLDLAPGLPEPSPARLAAEAQQLDADALLRVLLVPWQWNHAGDDLPEDPTRVEVFAEVRGYDRRGQRFLWDLFRSAPRDLPMPGDTSAPGELQDLLLNFAGELGARVGAEGFDAR